MQSHAAGPTYMMAPGNAPANCLPPKRRSLLFHPYVTELMAREHRNDMLRTAERHRIRVAFRRRPQWWPSRWPHRRPKATVIVIDISDLTQPVRVSAGACGALAVVPVVEVSR